MFTFRVISLKHVLLVLASLVLLSCNITTLTSDDSGESSPTNQPAPTRAAPTLDEDQEDTSSSAPSSNLVTALDEVKQAVVQIEAQGTFVDPEFGQYSGSGTGTGFIIDESGLAITNNHVVAGAALLKVWIGGDTTQQYNAKIIGVAECSDLALIDIEGDGYRYLEWYPGDINVGLEVFAAGFPLGDPEFTLTKGIISKENASGETSWASVESVLEHDATINPGNSGGPLVNTSGQVVGVNYATYAQANQYFAIGRDAAVPIIRSLESGQNVDTVGINGQAVVSEDGTLSGVWISSVTSGSQADQAGIQPGDLMTTLENLPLAVDGTMTAYCDIIRTQGDQNTLGVEVLRFPTNEYLVGQLNGRPLSAQDSIVSDPSPNSGNTTDGASKDSPVVGGNIVEDYGDGFINITDDFGALSIDVPASWNQIDGTMWSDYWGDLYFDAPSVIAAPDLEAFTTRFNASGVRFTASKDWGAIGGYIQLLDGIKYVYEDSCDWIERQDYVDEVYEGAYDFWQCGQDVGVVVIGARPSAAPTEYLTLVEVQVITEADVDALEAIMQTFDVIGYLP